MSKPPMNAVKSTGISDVDDKSNMKEDLTGRDRMVRNVLTSWAGHMVFVIAGFVMPRMIDRHIGQTSLGIWDFSWSLVNYFGLAGLGIGSSVNRYVAKYRAVNDIEGLRKAVSSVWGIQMVVSFVMVLAAVTVASFLPLWFKERLGAEMEIAQWVVVLLGLSLAVQMAFDIFRGVMTGCHRWDLYNGLNAGSYALIVIAMVITLIKGNGLRSLSFIFLFGTILTEVARAILAYRICPEMKVNRKYIGWFQTKKMLAFGLKRVLVAIPSVIVFQGASIFVVAHLGPAALAVFSRPIALVRHVEIFVSKLAVVLTPTTGSLQSSGRIDDIRQLLTKTTRLTIFISLPVILFLAILGDPILSLWMGQRYEHGLILAILSVGCFLPIIQQSILSILVGMNLHGRVWIMNFLLTMVSFGIGILILEIVGWSLVGTAMIVAISSSCGIGILVPVYACYKLHVPIQRFLKQVFLLPIACGILFAFCLVTVRLLFGNRPLLAVVAGALSGGLILGPLYWRYVVPSEISVKILSFFRRRRWSQSSLENKIGQGVPFGKARDSSIE